MLQESMTSQDSTFGRLSARWCQMSGLPAASSLLKVSLSRCRWSCRLCRSVGVSVGWSVSCCCCCCCRRRPRSVGRVVSCGWIGRPVGIGFVVIGFRRRRRVVVLSLDISNLGRRRCYCWKFGVGVGVGVVALVAVVLLSVRLHSAAFEFL